MRKEENGERRVEREERSKRDRREKSRIQAPNSVRSCCPVADDWLKLLLLRSHRLTLRPPFKHAT